MEKKKLLLVAVSVGVFLVIVVSAAILIFSPQPQNPVVAQDPFTESRSASVDASSMVQSSDLRNLQDPMVLSPIQENKIYINGESTQAEITTDKTDNSTKTVINIPRPSTAGVQNEAPAIKKIDSAKAAASSKPAVNSAPPAKTVAKSGSPSRKPKVSDKTRTDFWVQAGSFSSRERADSVKQDLSGKGIAAIITNQEVKGQTYYRVRVGPWTTKNEADYWLSMVKSIDGFQDSQVWQSQTRL